MSRQQTLLPALTGSVSYMGSIWCVMGKSSSGKDTLFEELKQRLPTFKTIIPYTTRPIREGEQHGVTYFFVSDETLNEYDKAGKIVELRSYDTIHGVWKYATVADGQINLAAHDYLIIGTLDSYQKLRDYYGANQVEPLYIEVREQEQTNPKYCELCRRFLADNGDFSDEKLEQASIKVRYVNEDKEQCLNEILASMMGVNK